MAREREFICQYGNCQESGDLKITVTDKDGNERPRFCSHEHAGLWLIRRAWIYGTRDETAATNLAAAVQRDLKN